MQVDGALRIGHVDDRCAVDLDRARERVGRLAGVVARIQNAAPSLRDRERLVGRPRLKIVCPRPQPG